MYELVTNGSVPYASFSNQQVRSKVTEGYRLPQPHNCPDELYSLMLHCWLPRATERPNFSDIVHNHLDPLKVKVHEGRLNRQNSTSDEAEGKRYCLFPPLLPPSSSLSSSPSLTSLPHLLSPSSPLSLSHHLPSSLPPLLSPSPPLSLTASLPLPSSPSSLPHPFSPPLSSTLKHSRSTHKLKLKEPSYPQVLSKGGSLLRVYTALISPFHHRIIAVCGKKTTTSEVVQIALAKCGKPELDHKM